MRTILAGAIAAAAIALVSGAARAETCIWLGFWSCGDSDKHYTRFYYPPAGPTMEITPVETPPMPASAPR